jgi:hypothetical protein
MPGFVPRGHQSADSQRQRRSHRSRSWLRGVPSYIRAMYLQPARPVLALHEQCEFSPENKRRPPARRPDKASSFSPWRNPRYRPRHRSPAFLAFRQHSTDNRAKGFSPLKLPFRTPPEETLFDDIKGQLKIKLPLYGQSLQRIEALERFVRREPLRRVHECVFGVLALETEPVDPRL